MRYKPIFQMLLFLGLLLQACNFGSSSESDPNDPSPQERSLPPITTTGENTFGCKINSEVWLPVGSVPFGQANLSASYFNGVLVIQSQSNTDNDRISLKLGLDNLYTKGTYTFDEDDEDLGGIFNNFNDDCETYRTGFIDSSTTIEILHIGNGYVSGTFEMILKQEGCPDIEITEGRFDVEYY